MSNGLPMIAAVGGSAAPVAASEFLGFRIYGPPLVLLTVVIPGSIILLQVFIHTMRYCSFKIDLLCP